MRVLRETLATLAENVALDSLLLDSCDGELEEPVLRLWHNPRPAIAIGKAERIVEALVPGAPRGIEVVRRFTAGGSVLVGPDCLCVSLVMPHRLWRPKTIYDAFERSQTLAVGALQQLGIDARFEPPSDIAVGDRKVSGCAQSRKRHGTAVHNTLLLDCDPGLMDACLRSPKKTPSYRAGRSHGDFVTSLRAFRPALGVEELADALVGTFCDDFNSPPNWTPLPACFLEKAREEAASLYATPAWTRRW